MNNKQILWTLEKCNELIALAQYPLTEANSKKIKEQAEKNYKESKRNQDVKQAMIITLNYINSVNEAKIKYDQEMKKKMGE